MHPREPAFVAVALFRIQVDVLSCASRSLINPATSASRLDMHARRRRVFGGLMSRLMTAMRPSPQAARLSDIHALRLKPLGQVDRGMHF